MSKTHRGYIVPFDDFCKVCRHREKDNYIINGCTYPERAPKPTEITEETCPIAKDLTTVDVIEDEHPEVGPLYFAYFKGQIIGEVN